MSLFSKKPAQQSTQQEFVKKNVNLHKDYKSYVFTNSTASWTEQTYDNMALSGYVKNVIANRCISLITVGASHIPLRVRQNNQITGQSNSPLSKSSSSKSSSSKSPSDKSPSSKSPSSKSSPNESFDKSLILCQQIQDLLNRPSSTESSFDFFRSLYSYKIISGNAYIRAVKDSKGQITKLETLNPERVSVLLSRPNNAIKGYRVRNPDNSYIDYPIQTKFFSTKDKTPDTSRVPTSNSTSTSATAAAGTSRASTSSKKTSYSIETCDILHIKEFHPLDSIYGLSALEVARYAIDQYNELSSYCKSLLQNSARPSGALVVKANDYNQAGTLTDEQFTRLKEELDTVHTNSSNTGRPMLLEGGLEWKEMSVSPKDMDFIEHRHSLAREIALSFGVPPQMLGIPGDNTYSNMNEARKAMWEQTIIPMMTQITTALSGWISNLINEPNLEITFNQDKIVALEERRNTEWNRIANCPILSDEEKREMLGLQFQNKPKNPNPL